jgi:uncharacterized membrane-anchored protein
MADTVPDLDSNRVTTLLGALAAVVGLVGYLVFDWRFDGSSSGPLVTALAVVAVVVAVASTLRGA